MTSKNITPSNYRKDIETRLQDYESDGEFNFFRRNLLNQMNWKKYAYNFCWFGRPVIQMPQDTMTFQEIIWEVCPDLIIETGVAHGGSAIFSASMLAMLEVFGLVESPRVIAIDIDIRPHNRDAIQQHPASRWIEMLEGSSVEPSVVDRVRQVASEKKRILVFLDSDHTHLHVLSELRAYAPLVSVGSYCVVLDTGIEDIDPSAIAPGRAWCKGNSPGSAVREFLESNQEFAVDNYFHNKAWATSAPGGFLRRLKG